MADVHQLIKKDINKSGKYKNIFPWTYTESVKDRETGEILDETLSRFNFYYLAYAGTTADTRMQLSDKYRKKGAVVGYLDYDNFLHIEFYITDDISDTQWKLDTNWLPLFSFFNGYFIIPFKENFANTVLQINYSYRNYGTVVCFDDGHKLPVFKCYTGHDISDAQWQDEANWEGLSWEVIQSYIKDSINSILNNFNEYPEIESLIQGMVDHAVRVILTEEKMGEILEDMIRESINEIAGDFIIEVKVEDNILKYRTSSSEVAVYDFSTILNSINTLTENVRDINDDINSINEDIDNIESNVSQLTNNINSLQQSHTELSQTVTNLSQSTSEINETINSIEDTVGSLDDTIKTDGTSTQYLGGDGKYHDISEYDDVIDVYASYQTSETGDISDIHLYMDSSKQVEITEGNVKTVYVDIDPNGVSYQFKWTGSVFIKIGGSPLVLGTIEGTAFEGSAGKELQDKVAKLPGYVVGAPLNTGMYFDHSEDGKYELHVKASAVNSSHTSSIEDILELTEATTTESGVMSASDKEKLDKVITSGDGSSYLTNDGTYKVIIPIKILDWGTDLKAGNGVLTSEVSQILFDYLSGKNDVVIKYNGGSAGSATYKIISTYSPSTGGYGGINFILSYQNNTDWVNIISLKLYSEDSGTTYLVSTNWNNLFPTTLSVDYAASDTDAQPAAGDTYENAISKLHKMINDLQTKVTALESALAVKDGTYNPLG